MPATILIVEDTKDIREALKMLLEFQGYEVIEAAGGREAVEQAMIRRPDLILMDIAMPELDGLDATRTIRSNPATSQIPILAVTSHGREFSAEALEAGCDEVMSKSSFMENFERTLEKYLNR